MFARISRVRLLKIGPDFFVKFDLEIAIDQQTRACDRTFEGVPDSHRCPRDSHAHFAGHFSEFGRQIFLIVEHRSSYGHFPLDTLGTPDTLY